MNKYLQSSLCCHVFVQGSVYKLTSDHIWVLLTSDRFHLKVQCVRFRWKVLSAETEYKIILVMFSLVFNLNCRNNFLYPRMGPLYLNTLHLKTLYLNTLYLNTLYFKNNIRSGSCLWRQPCFFTVDWTNSTFWVSMTTEASTGSLSCLEGGGGGASAATWHFTTRCPWSLWLEPLM